MAMLGLPYLCSRFEKKVWAGLVAGIVLPYILFGLVKQIPIYEKNYVLQDLAQCFLYLISVAISFAGVWLHQKIVRSNFNIEERYEKGN